MSDTKDDDNTLRSTHGVHVQPDPIPNDHPSAHDLLIAEVGRRKAFGIAKYGVTLQPFNGRDPLKDALDEAIDLCVYLVTAIEERDGKPEVWERFEDIPLGMMFRPKSMPGLILEKLPKDLYAVKVRPNAYADIAIVVADHAPFVRADS